MTDLNNLIERQEALKDELNQLNTRIAGEKAKAADKAAADLWKKLEQGAKMFASGPVAKWYHEVKDLVSDLRELDPAFAGRFNMYSVDTESPKGQCFARLAEKISGDTPLDRAMMDLFKRSGDNPFIGEVS